MDEQKRKQEEKAQKEKVKKELDRERYILLEQIQDKLEFPLIVLGFAWLVLLVAEFIWGLHPALQILVNIIWIIFILDFLLKFILAPHKIDFLKKNVLTIISLAIPALRIFRIARFIRVLRGLRAVRGIRLVRVISSINRGMRSLGAAMQRRAIGYVVLLTLIVLFAGAAGMSAFENHPDSQINDYMSALWWTAMILANFGSEYWPKTPEGRTLCLLLAIYGVSIFGYITATLATFFIGQDADNNNAEVAGTKQINELRDEIVGLREELKAVLTNINNASGKEESKS